VIAVDVIAVDVIAFEVAAEISMGDGTALQYC
jgi:hypothetical protein